MLSTPAVSLGRGGEVEMWRGGEVERGRGGEVERWRGGEVERGRGGELIITTSIIIRMVYTLWRRTCSSV